jgi:hypothetical protein
MEISVTKEVPVQAKTLAIHMKVCDGFVCRILDQDGASIKDYEGYVPHFMPGEPYGDYVILDIDIDTGQITNWRQVKSEDIEEFINIKEE